ncbi:MAG: hypothetical protein EHM12_09405 [Dehalococcoidia bacterium]|nr:MAG: hypothetical protein EHM12_09405 [Dehalococcoidia bacterium]
MKKNHFISGEWNVTCDVCSKKIKAHEARQRWDGFIVCPDDMEQRHPQDFVKAQTDKISVPFQRPIPTYIFVDVPYICTIDGVTGVVGYAVAGCSIVGNA